MASRYARSKEENIGLYMYGTSKQNFAWEAPSKSSNKSGSILKYCAYDDRTNSALVSKKK
jgi:hypothetical protein